MMQGHCASVEKMFSFRKTAADTLVLAIVGDHMPQKQARLTDTAELVADLGFDSVAITETPAG